MDAVIRKASKMRVFPECYGEYKKRHDELWPEMRAMLKEHGARDYSIFLDEETGALFAYVEIESERRWNEIARTEVCRKWWAYMRDIMETNADGSPKATDLREVFYLE